MHLLFYHNRKKRYFRLWFRVLQPIFSCFRLCFGYRVLQPITDTITDFFRVRVSDWNRFLEIRVFSKSNSIDHLLKENFLFEISAIYFF